jgi:hypothetical protein
MATSATDALYQQYIAAGLSPEDARMAANFDLSKYQSDYQAQQQFIANAPKYEVPGAYDYTTQYGGMDIIPGMTSGILANLGIENPIVPVFQLLGSENKGEANNAEERMQFIATPGATYRLKNNETGEIIGTAATPEELSSLVQQSNAMSQQLGTSANLTVQRSNPQSIGGGYTDMFTDSPDKVMNTITKLALAGMVAATGAGLLQPGGLGGLGATGASGAGIGTTGSLAGAGLSSLPANLAAIQAGANAALAGAGLGTAAGLGAAAGGGLLASGIEALPAITVTGAAGGGLTAAQLAALASLGGVGASLGATGGATGASSNLSMDQFGNVVDQTGAIVATGTGGSTSLLPAAGAAAAAGGAAAATGGGAGGATDAAITQNTQNAVDTAYTNAQTGAKDILNPVYGAGTGGSFVVPATAASSGVLGTGLSVGQLATIGSLGASALGSLFGGSGGTTGTGTPYVSPFGAGGTMAGGDFRASPAIADYERYGFGPEASFFRPEYYGLVSGGASKGYTPPAGTTTPTYTPLIGGTTTGGTPSGGGGGGGAGGGGGGGGGGTAVTKQVRPAGFTGVVSGQQVGDTQVVDGNTWVWGGDDLGWQQKFTNGLLSTGNGATNVTSFANNPTVEVNQPAFAQNTAIPGWATTYHGFQQSLMNAGITGDAKAAAERELFTAIETQPFASATDLVDYAKGLYTKYTANPLMTTAQLQASSQPSGQAIMASQQLSANQRAANDLLSQAANFVSDTGYTPAAGTVIQSPEWDRLYLDYVTGKSDVMPPRLAGFTPEEFQRRIDAQIARGAENAQQTVDYWNAVRTDPRYAAAAQYEMATGESAGGGPYIPAGYAAIGDSVVKMGTPQYEQAIRGLI